jgi:hypothetical protein
MHINHFVMKKMCFSISILIAVVATAQNNDYLISMKGLGKIKLGMSHSELETILNKKIVMTKNYLDTLNGYYQDTAKIKYNNADVLLEFERSYFAPYKFRMRLVGIRSGSPSCKTASGIGIGSDRSNIIREYDNYHINIYPVYPRSFKKENRNGESVIRVLDDAASTMDGSDAYTMVFYLLNKKVISFELKAILKDERE